MNIELSQVILNNGLTFLAVVTAVAIGFIGFYLVKLLRDLSELAKNTNETSIILNTELKISDMIVVNLGVLKQN